MLADLDQRFGNLGLAAAAYNAGPTRVANWARRRRHIAGRDSRLRLEDHRPHRRGLGRRRQECDHCRQCKKYSAILPAGCDYDSSRRARNRHGHGALCALGHSTRRQFLESSRPGRASREPGAVTPLCSATCCPSSLARDCSAAAGAPIIACVWANPIVARQIASAIKSCTSEGLASCWRIERASPLEGGTGSRPFRHVMPPARAPWHQPFASRYVDRPGIRGFAIHRHCLDRDAAFCARRASSRYIWGISGDRLHRNYQAFLSPNGGHTSASDRTMGF